MAEEKPGLWVKFAGLVACLLFTGFCSRSCHASVSWDNANPFSEGFLKASRINDEADRLRVAAENAKNAPNGDVVVCEYYMHIAQLLDELPYEANLARTYREQAQPYCGH